MDIRIQSIKFNADQKLLDFINKKVERLGRFDDTITDIEVALSLEEKPDNKCVKIMVAVKGGVQVIERTAKSFEEAATEAVDLMKEKLTRNKEKRGE